MNMDKIDLEALQRDLQEFAQQQKQRGWFRRNWRWFIPALILAIGVLGGGAIYWSLYLRIYGQDLCRSSMQTIAADKGLRESLGEPIRTVKWPSQETTPNARIEEREADILWYVEGPKGRAKVHAKARRQMGKWETNVLDVVLPDGKKVSLLKDDGANDALPFVPQKPEAGKPAAGGPPPEINMPEIPDEPPMDGK